MQPLNIVQTSTVAVPAVHLPAEGECRADAAFVELYDGPPVTEATAWVVAPVLLPCHLPSAVIPLASGTTGMTLAVPDVAGPPAVVTAGKPEQDPEAVPDGVPAETTVAERTWPEVFRLPGGAVAERSGLEPTEDPEQPKDVSRAKADRARPESPPARPMTDSLLTDHMTSGVSAEGDPDTGGPIGIMPPAFPPTSAVPARNGQPADKTDPTGPKVGAALSLKQVSDHAARPDVSKAVDAVQADAAPVRPSGLEGNVDAGDSTGKRAPVNVALPTGREGSPAKHAISSLAADLRTWPAVATEGGAEARVFPVKDEAPGPKAVLSPAVVLEPGSSRDLDAWPALAPASTRAPTRAETLWHMAVGPSLDMPDPEASSIPESPPTPPSRTVDIAVRSQPVPPDLAPATSGPLGLSSAWAEDVSQVPGPFQPGAAQPPASTVPLVSVPQAPFALVPQLATAVVDSLVHTPDGVTEIRLSPEELGNVRVTLRTDAANPDRVTVMLSFDRPDTLDLFRRHAEQLTDALRLAGYSQADIGFGQHGAGQSPFGRAGQGTTEVDGSRDGPPGAEQPVPAGVTGIRQPSLSATSLDLRL